MKKPESLWIGFDDPFEIIDLLKEFVQDPWFQHYAEETALKMVTHLLSDSGKTWREAARDSSKGRLIYNALLKEMQGPLGGAVAFQIQRNAEYIKSVPLDIAREMTQHVMEQSLQGVRARDIANQLKERYSHISSVKANLIARTETSKTSTALNQSRSEILGIHWYRWRTSEDSRVRDSHRKMDKVLVAWDDPPSPEALDDEKSVGHYQAGCIWNCRCYAEPLVDLSFVQWPCRVYINGSITTMSRKLFERLTTHELAVAKAI